jgi:hypothetical protein
LHWWRKLWPNLAESPLIPAPASARWKTYLADSGHTYQYRFQGQRQFKPGGTEYVFQVADRFVAVTTDDGIFETRRATHGRDLSSEERFALAKMVLRDAMDIASTPAELPIGISAGEADIERIFSVLDL